MSTIIRGDIQHDHPLRLCTFDAVETVSPFANHINISVTDMRTAFSRDGTALNNVIRMGVLITVMVSRRTHAIFDFFGNLAVVGLILLFRRESARIEQLRHDGSLDEIRVPESCAIDEQEIDAAELQTTFAAEVIEEVDIPTVRTGWFFVGIASAVVYRMLYDRDIGGIRRSRVRRWALILGMWVGQLLLSLDDRETSHSLGVGSSVGAVCYRVKYGLLDDLPEN
ncbi:uncharacterized protein Nmag_4071 (plasmid) [Natrialba magadii ATCC 43099]|uniref:DUF8097 domain-containing protein n=1 Tax=Natrialba magadii (strain ATCC 43099 / DSM 3394 / CCM 3739 / CIP 104546 / IAM 13178 / JCM 8861 / NBRC 102185 / NCIMB 2190 / MS3) TaxID=547559 RepID=D3T1Y7_NATMM|nr:hypothetical protein [Natrialba magadii]ADD07596.1 uncharacterized protein Nmag_4071 [Natrialba magadii ATCC 43099]ELY27071.1 hypothetical protein C500_14575 [Natrialba magadii ATCC 43099]